jgi:formate dehydrogenase beta subunit
MAAIKLTIDGAEVEIEQGKTVLEAAQAAGIYIPALCAHPDLPTAPGTKPESVIYLGGQPCETSDPEATFQGCRLCIVEVEGMDDLQTSCTLPAAEGMVVSTGTSAVQEARKRNLKAILARHPHACLTCSQREGCSPFESCPNSLPVLERCCSKLGYCELQGVAEYVGISTDLPPYKHRGLPVKNDEPLFTQDYNLCIGCTRCVRVCRDVRGIGALGFIERNGGIIAGPVAPTLRDSGCKFCGACVEVCPTGALLDKDVKRAEREASLVPCGHACPAGIDVPRYVRLAAEGKFDEALSVVRERVPFPRVLGRVCFHPCESVCRRGDLNEPRSIAKIKRFVADRAAGQEGQSQASPTGKTVAVVGSGPAGLTAAFYLARLGHAATVFEALSEAGGMMRAGIPDYRLPGDVLDAEIDEIRRAGVEILTNSPIETLDALRDQGYDAILVATGAHSGVKMGVDGEDRDGVVEGISFLRDINLSIQVRVGDRVAVAGGGNAAIDAARSALRQGAREVTIVYRRSRDEMPANPEEVEAALEEGVKIEFLAGPSRISSKDGSLALECVRMELGEPDSSGRRRPVPVEGSEYETEVDTIIAAIGQTPDIPDGFELDVIGGGRLKVDQDTLGTGQKGVFAGGDAVSGPASVIEAIAAGRKAASSIDKYLGGRGQIDGPSAGPLEASPWFGRDEGFYDLQRVHLPCLDTAKRTGSFDEVELGYDRGMAASEAARCLRCDVRLHISPVMLPPSDWLEFTDENMDAAPETEGVFRLFDEQKEIVYIGSGTSIREALQDLDRDDEWMQKVRYLHYEETMMYTMRESELMQQFLQEHGRMPEGNEDLF